jgi:hypothetical protein
VGQAAIIDRKKIDSIDGIYGTGLCLSIVGLDG